jgi:hypothetical protein
MDHVTRLMRRYREFVTDPAWRAELGRREAANLERSVPRLMEWDQVSEELPVDTPKHRPTPPGGVLSPH